jgi:hypothetical protein
MSTWVDRGNLHNWLVVCSDKEVITCSITFQCLSDATVCNSRPCLNGGLCNVTAAGFKCTCSPGFVGSICEHGGT